LPQASLHDKGRSEEKGKREKTEACNSPRASFSTITSGSCKELKKKEEKDDPKMRAP